MLVCLLASLSGCDGDESKNAPLVLIDGVFRPLSASELAAMPIAQDAGLSVFVTESLRDPRPVSGAYVDVIDSGDINERLETDDSGMCYIDSVVKGEIAVAVDDERYPPNRGVAYLSDGQRFVVVLLDAVSKVKGRVFSAETGEPIRNYEIRFLGDSAWISRRWRGGFVELETEDGVFEAEGVRSIWGAAVRADGYATHEIILRPGSPLDQQTFEFPLERASIVLGQVTDRDGDPIQDVEIRTESLRRWEIDIDRVVTDREGRFRIDDSAETPEKLLAIHSDFAPTQVSVPVGSPDEAVYVSAVMDSGSDVSGTVTLDGAPVLRATVELRSVPFVTGQLHTTRDDGVFRFTHVPPGPFTLTARLPPLDVDLIPRDSPERVAIRESIATADGVAREDIAFTQSAALLEGFVRLGDAVAIATVSLAYREGADQIILKTEADDGGWYQLTGMPAGIYVVCIEAAVPDTIRRIRDINREVRLRYDSFRRYHTVTVPEDGYVQQDFDLLTGGVIRGVVHGLPERAEDVFVRMNFVWPDRGGAAVIQPEIVMIANDGSFEADGLPPGTYHLDIDVNPPGRSRTSSGRSRRQSRDGELPADRSDPREVGETKAVEQIDSPVVEVVIDGDNEVEVELFASAQEAAPV
jgi:hypothetical protein